MNSKIFGCALVFAVLFGISATGQDAENRINVSGYHRHLVEPDMAHLSFAVVRSGDNVSALKKEVDQVAAAVVTFAEQLGIDSEDLTATAISVQPNFEHTREGVPRILGATVSRSLQVTLRDLSRYIELVDGALARKINRVDQVRMASSKQAEHEADALELAIADAKSEAAQAARHFGVEIVAVVNVTVGDSGRPQPMANVRYATAAMAESGGFRPGTIAIERRVSAEFKFK